MEREFKTLGLAVAKKDHGEADTVTTILTPDMGQLDVLSYGARKSRKAVRTGLYSEAVYSLSSTRDGGRITVRDVDTVALRENILSDLDATLWASLCSEMVVKGRSADPYIYSLLASVLDAADSGDAEKGAIYFMVNYLSHEGFTGDWKHCPVCHSLFGEDEVLGFSTDAGTYVCSSCDNLSASLVLPPSARRYVAAMAEADLGSALSWSISDMMVRRISRNLLRSLRYTFPARLRILDAGLITM